MELGFLKSLPPGSPLEPPHLNQVLSLDSPIQHPSCCVLTTALPPTLSTTGPAQDLAQKGHTNYWQMSKEIRNLGFRESGQFLSGHTTPQCQAVSSPCCTCPHIPPLDSPHGFCARSPVPGKGRHFPKGPERESPLPKATQQSQAPVYPHWATLLEYCSKVST